MNKAQDTKTVTELGGKGLLELLSDGKDPQIACQQEEREACAYKREYDKHLSRYNIEKLLQWPTCESCGCPLVVIQDE